MKMTLHANDTVTVRTSDIMMEFRDLDLAANGRLPFARDLRVGDEGCLVCATGGEGSRTWLQTAPVSGNGDSSQRRYHGWRGTTNNVCVMAHGWRRVVSIRRYRNGVTTVKFSEDLRPTEA